MHRGDTKPTSNTQFPKCLAQVIALNGQMLFGKSFSLKKLGSTLSLDDSSFSSTLRIIERFSHHPPYRSTWHLWAILCSQRMSVQLEPSFPQEVTDKWLLTQGRTQGETSLNWPFEKNQVWVMHSTPTWGSRSTLTIASVVRSSSFPGWLRGKGWIPKFLTLGYSWEWGL